MTIRLELLYPSGTENVAYMTAHLKNERKAVVELTPRLARVFVVLGDARRQDLLLNRDPIMLGWRSREQIAAMIEDITNWPITTSTVTAYVTESLKRIKAEIELVSGEVNISLIERGQKRGLRLAPDVDLDVINEVDDDGCT